MRLNIQLVNVFKEFEVMYEFALDEAQMHEYVELKKKYEDLIEKHEKAMEEYSNNVNQFQQEGKLPKMPENHSGKGPSFFEDFEPKYENLKKNWQRRWHSIELIGQEEANVSQLVDEINKQLPGPKMNMSQVVAGKYRAFRAENGNEIGQQDKISNNEKIIVEFIR